MTEAPRVKTELWVQAQVWLCNAHAIPIVVVRRGDADAGAVLLRLVRPAGKCLLLRRVTVIEGVADWMVVAGGGEVDQAAAEALVAREVGRDRDLWVVEVDDPKGRYWPDRAPG